MIHDVYDTSRCPVAGRCEWCDGAEGLAVAAATTSIGVACVLMCAKCHRSRWSRPWLTWSPAEAHARVAQHAGHLGVSVDEARAATEGGAS